MNTSFNNITHQEYGTYEDRQQYELFRYLMEEWGFKKIHKNIQKEEIDIDKFDLILRVHETHYLFYSHTHKCFSIGIRHTHPKGIPGSKGRIQEYTTVMLPKVIKTILDAHTLLMGILN